MPTRELDDDPMLHGCQVWCIDNDPSVCQIIHTLLERWHCAVGFTGSLDEALITAATAPPPELILMDTSIDEHGDTPLIPLLMTHWGHTPRVILMTSEEDPTLRDRALNRGWGFLGKTYTATGITCTDDTNTATPRLNTTQNILHQPRL